MGGKFIIVEDGKPRAVLMSYEEFSDLAAPQAAQEIMKRFSQVEEINREITRAQLQELPDWVEEVIEPESPDQELKIEPLDAKPESW